MKGYTVGFVFNSDLTQVALVTKTHPDWQKGKLNGIGGKIEDGESALACMVREIKEEAGFVSRESDWTHVLSMQRPNLYVEFYACRHQGPATELRTMTDEQVAWYPVAALPQNVVPNLRWILPLAVDRYTDESITAVEIRHSSSPQ